MVPGQEAGNASPVWDSLVDLASASAWTYAVVLGFAALDAVAPLVPSEMIVVAASALAASDRLNLGLVVAAAAAGAVVGDNAYSGLIGFFGGSAFEDEPLVGVGLAIGVAFVIAALVEGGRRLYAGRR